MRAFLREKIYFFLKRKAESKGRKVGQSKRRKGRKVRRKKLESSSRLCRAFLSDFNGRIVAKSERRISAIT